MTNFEEELKKCKGGFIAFTISEEVGEVTLITKKVYNTVEECKDAAKFNLSMGFAECNLPFFTIVSLSNLVLVKNGSIDDMKYCMGDSNEPM
jgi:hypothetical protein